MKAKGGLQYPSPASLAFLPDLNPGTSARRVWNWLLISQEHEKNEETRSKVSQS